MYLINHHWVFSPSGSCVYIFTCIHICSRVCLWWLSGCYLSFFYLSFFFVGLFHGFFAPCTAPQYAYYKDSTVNTFSNPNCGLPCVLLLLLPEDLIPPLLQDESHLWEQQKCFYVAWNVLTTKDNNLAIPTVGSRTLSCRFYQRPTCLTEIMW